MARPSPPRRTSPRTSITRIVVWPLSAEHMVLPALPSIAVCLRLSRLINDAPFRSCSHGHIWPTELEKRLVRISNRDADKTRRVVGAASRSICTIGVVVHGNVTRGDRMEGQPGIVQSGSFHVGAPGIGTGYASSTRAAAPSSAPSGPVYDCVTHTSLGRIRQHDVGVNDPNQLKN